MYLSIVVLYKTDAHRSIGLPRFSSRYSVKGKSSLGCVLFKIEKNPIASVVLLAPLKIDVHRDIYTSGGLKYAKVSRYDVQLR
ncbi:hypothetical protein KIN20_003306 [Parelaphostrongylus tenuis]|uniref:Uncharacterized protein n=1 Tax=Parelaphostrongylus tenuis TaxID=148309 RepID=A0AAD5QFY7_PARTN|nr:hypothetical protein KIN20_003306 [Parelaphostrongylus tenuis]